MFELVHAERASFSISFSCRVLGVSRSGYYRWINSGPSTRDVSDATLSVEIRTIHQRHKGRYGSPRIHRELRETGHRVGRKRVARLMRENALFGHKRRRFRHTTNSRHHHRIAPNLVARDFQVETPNHTWVGDITYVPTRDGWVYLAVLIDLFARRVVGWAMSDQIDTSLALNALQMAVSQRNPQPGLVHHTDRDCRYASDNYQAALAQYQMRPSMSRKADCWDNAVAESFFATLEKELLHQPLKSRSDIRAEIADYIENYYNVERRHSFVDYATPLEYELRAA